MSTQLSLLSDVLACYEDGPLLNADLYQKLARKHQVDLDEHVRPVGKQVAINVYKRKVRWLQQDLKQAGMIESLGKNQWRLTTTGKQTLTQTLANKHLVAGSTALGVFVWCNSDLSALGGLDKEVHLCLTSPPYLGIERSYGTHYDEKAFLDFIIRVIEKVRIHMVPGANLALNMTNDSILKKRFGERSRYLERLVLRLSDDLDLHLMDRLVWEAPDKCAKGYQVTHARTHLTSRYEPILWFCTDPEHCLADNRRVLQPYGDAMQRILKEGGVKEGRRKTDYHPNSRKGGFSVNNGGSIPGNVIRIATKCKANIALLKKAREMGLPTHGALFPLALSDFLVKWLCPEGGRVVDPFSGYGNSAFSAEMSGRFWWACEWHWEYLKPAVARMMDRPECWINPIFDSLSDESLRKTLAS